MFAVLEPISLEPFKTCPIALPDTNKQEWWCKTTHLLGSFSDLLQFPNKAKYTQKNCKLLNCVVLKEMHMNKLFFPPTWFRCELLKPIHKDSLQKGRLAAVWLAVGLWKTHDLCNNRNLKSYMVSINCTSNMDKAQKEGESAPFDSGRSMSL